jgi:hypothetical protein
MEFKQNLQRLFPFSHLLCKLRDNGFPVHRLDAIKKESGRPCLVPLQRANQVKADCGMSISESAKFFYAFFYPALAKIQDASLEGFFRHFNRVEFRHSHKGNFIPTPADNTAGILNSLFNFCYVTGD